MNKFYCIKYSYMQNKNHEKNGKQVVMTIFKIASNTEDVFVSTQNPCYKLLFERLLFCDNYLVIS